MFPSQLGEVLDGWYVQHSPPSRVILELGTEKHKGFSSCLLCVEVQLSQGAATPG